MTVKLWKEQLIKPHISILKTSECILTLSEASQFSPPPVPSSQLLYWPRPIEVIQSHSRIKLNLTNIYRNVGDMVDIYICLLSES